MRHHAWLIAPMTVAAALLLAAIAIGKATWVEVLTHPLRAERLGGVPPTTIEAADLIRWLWPSLAAGIVLASLVLSRIAVVAPNDGHGEGIRPSSRMALWGVVGLTVVAAVLRAPRLAESLWFDEIATLLDYAQFGPGPIVANAFTQANHTLHTLLTWIAMALAGGVDEVILRMPAVVASLLTVPAMWWLTREVVPERPPAALWCAAVVAVMPVIVLSGAEARGYSMMILGAATSTALLLRALRRGHPGDWWWYALCCAALVWTHLVAVCIPLGHGVIVVWILRTAEGRASARAALAALPLAALLTVALLTPQIPDLLAIRGDFVAADGDEPRLWGPEGWHALLQFGGAWRWWAALPGLALALLGLVTLRRTGPGAIALASGLIGGAIAVGLTVAGDSWLYARFLLFMLPTAALAIAVAIDRLAAAPRTRWIAVGAASLTVLVWSADLLTRPEKQPLRDAVALVAQWRQPGETVAAIGLADNVVAYYGQTHGIDIVGTGPLGSQLESVLRSERPAWMIVLYPNSIAADRFERLAAAGLVERARLPGWVDWNNGDVLVFGPPEPIR